MKYELRVAYPNELYHHGIKGQKWGIRKYQNPDGSLTPAGKKRYYKSDGTLTRAGKKWDKKNKEEEFKKKKAEFDALDTKVQHAEQKYLDEFDKSEHGRRLKNEYEKSYDDISYMDWNDPQFESANKKFVSAEKKYLKTAQRYVGDKVQKEFGNEVMKQYAIDDRMATYKTGMARLGARDIRRALKGKTYAEWYETEWELHRA